MNYLVAKPQQLAYPTLFEAYMRKQQTMGGNIFEDVGDFLNDGITGLTDALGGALEMLGKTIEDLAHTIELVVRASFGDVSWDEVLDSTGKIFQDIGAIIVYLDPSTQLYNWLSTSELTAHAFHELDKFTGGMLTTTKNVSSLVGRAMRGDPISKQELLGDCLFIIQVCLVVFTAGAWVAVGVAIGTMVGREVCQHQTEAKDACMVAFQILGAAAGGWGQAVYSAGFSSAEEAAWLAGDDAYAEFLEKQAQAGFSVAEENAWLEGDAAYAKYIEQQAAAGSTSFIDHLALASQNTLDRIGIDEVTKQAVRLCQSSNIIGNHECAILGHIASDYIKSGQDQEWSEFLATEVGKIGAEELMMQWFPKESKERLAIQRRWQIKYQDVPVDQVVVQTYDTKKILLAAGAIALVALGAS